MVETKTVASLIAELPGAVLAQGDGSATVAGVEHDSRHVTPGALFVAIPGFNTDGHTYLSAAAAAGAVAAVVARGRREAWSGLPGLTVVEVEEPRAALSAVAAWFYGHPGREMVTIGITGTDGKTTTSHFLTSVLEAGGARVGRLGTVDTYLPGETGSVGDRMTTPEANEVQRLLRHMADAGCEYAVVESTSHGLALHRLDHVYYDIAIMTNVTGDHLDFHKTFEAYREAKGILFEALTHGPVGRTRRTAVVNADDPSASYMLGRAEGAAALRFGLEAREVDVTARDIVLGPAGSEFLLVGPGGTMRTRINAPAIFNVENALAAAAGGLAAGLDIATVSRGLGDCPGVPGRMERIDAGQPFEVIVDYAHTGEAVRKVLAVLREVSHGRLIIVVGAAGERDPGRRFGVGRAAVEGADFAVFTNEDPRSEDPAEIVREIGRHAEGAGRVRGSDFIEVEDRGEAIRAALGRAAAGDLVVVCGKGHEQSIVYGTEARPWDDRRVVREALAALGYTGPEQ